MAKFDFKVPEVTADDTAAFERVLAIYHALDVKESLDQWCEDNGYEGTVTQADFDRMVEAYANVQDGEGAYLQDSEEAAAAVSGVMEGKVEKPFVPCRASLTFEFPFSVRADEKFPDAKAAVLAWLKSDGGKCEIDYIVGELRSRTFDDEADVSVAPKGTRLTVEQAVDEGGYLIHPDGTECTDAELGLV